ncbi:unnamed protein product, partial [Discosporangium mesarthrocarpum]
VHAASYAEVQFAGLEALYNVTSGEEWIVSTGWRNGTIGVCEWDGITCDDGDNVTTVSLPANG